MSSYQSLKTKIELLIEKAQSGGSSAELEEVLRELAEKEQIIKDIIQGTAVSVIIPEGVTEVADYKFYNDKTITSVAFPDSVTKIGATFYGCTNLTINESLPPNLTEIGGNAFSQVKGTFGGVLPDGITIIDTGAFRQCPDANFRVLPSALITISSQAFNTVPKSFFAVIPASVDSIGQYGLPDGKQVLAAERKSITFKGAPSHIDSRACPSTYVQDIYVPWSEGEVANAPWGMTNATIHYNYTEDEV